MAQEFVDAYGQYESLPAKAKPGQRVHVAGEVHEPVKFGGVGLARIDLPEPLGFEVLSSRGGYNVPEPYVIYFPAGYKTPKPVAVEGSRFSIEVELAAPAAAGLYEVSIWGQHGGEKALVPISLRTIPVR
jgi:hypothetical protein